MQQQQPQPSQSPQVSSQQTQGYQQVPSQDFQQRAPSSIQSAVRDLDELETVAEWAHTKAMQQGQTQVATITNQVSEIAHLQKKLILGQSQVAGTFGQCTSQSFQQIQQQLQQYGQVPAVQDVLQEIQYTTQSIDQANQQLQQWSQQGQSMGSQPVGGQSQFQQY